jgi:DNA (cytosine-5)-methyltransferase 1
MTRPRLLDLFCGAGGCSVGYHRAGFDVVGVDINPQPRYPYEFIQADALEVLAFLTDPEPWEHYEDWLPAAKLIQPFDAIHASPTCKAHTVGRNMWKGRLPDDRHPDLLTPTRARLLELGTPWIIENVPGAPMRPDLELCGSMFGLGVRRHRWFELSFTPTVLITPCRHDLEIISVFGGGALSATPRGGSRNDTGKHTVMQHRVHVAHSQAERAMGIDWMTRDELSQAIPPAYTEYVGAQLLAHLKAAA